MGTHVFGATDKERLWHSILPDQTFFGDVLTSSGTGRPWSDVSPIPTLEDVACAADGEGDLHALVVTSDGRLWHTIRADATGRWSKFGDVEIGGAGNIGAVTAVAAATQGRNLHVVAVNRTGELHRTTWNHETPTSSASWDPRFSRVGFWDPATGPLERIAASFSSPTQVTLEGVPVLREVHGGAFDLRVARLQHMLNLSWLGAGQGTPASELLAENGIYDARTAKAVRSFQGNKDLPVNGIMTRATWKVFLEWWLSGDTPG
jgi:peptidoglycan hydrolase-like protein with peptidoglycan-binding domain